MSCIWCHNPETQKKKLEVAFNGEKCSGCGSCLSSCEMGAMSLDHGVISRNESACRHCRTCLETCPTDALFSYGKTASVSEVLTEICKDRSYYELSGGGVTLSGGEPLMQSKFALALLESCKNNLFHTCLDTCGYVSAKEMEKSLEWTDLYHFDIKASEESIHRRLTGVRLEPVLKNLEILSRSSALIRLRCPIIPGVNDDESHLENILGIAGGIDHLDGVDFLTWHNMGNKKIKNLGRNPDSILPLHNTTEEQKERLREWLEKRQADFVKVL